VARILKADILTLGYVVLGVAALALLPALFACLRLATLTLFSIFHFKTRPRKNPSAKIAVLLYAHNQEFFVEKAVREIITATEYPQELFDVVVVADNCDDSTSYLATFAGARTLERIDKIEEGRHFALEWAFAKLMTEEYDAFLVSDVDAMLHPKTLPVLDAALAKGALAIRLPFRVVRADESWRTRLDDVTAAAREYLIPRGESVSGLSAGLPATGFCIARSLLREIPYQAFSPTEYADYHVKLVLAGERAVFARGAELESRNPIPSLELERRSRELENGPRSAAAKNLGELVKASLAFNCKAFECLCAASAPPLSLLGTILFVVFMAGALLAFGGASMPLCEPLIFPAVVVMAGAALGALALAAHVAIAVLEGGLPISTWPVLLLAPLRSFENVASGFGRNAETR